MSGESYGRVPAGTPPYLTGTVAAVGRIVAALPARAPSEWRRIAYRTVLSGVLRDWVEHGADELSEIDRRDLADLVRLAAQVALDAEYSHRDDTFVIVCAALIDDWVRNWNVEDDEAE